MRISKAQALAGLGGLAIVAGLVGAAVGLAGASGPPHDVPTYRGDAARTGVMPGPGPSGLPAVVWSYQAPAPLRSSPSVVGDAVFAASVDGSVVALALADGTPRWTVQIGAAIGSATPTITDALVVIGDRAGVVHALDAGTGAERWQRALDGPIGGAAVAVGDRVIVATEHGTAAALDARTGTVIWQHTLPAGVSRSICAADGTAYFAMSGGLLAALRSSDGTQLWSVTLAAGGEGGTPSTAEGLVFEATGLDGKDPADRGVVALDARTGAVRWRRPSASGDVLYTPAIAGGVAYVIGEDDTVAALDATTGTERWLVTTSAPIDALPAIWATTLYVGDTEGGLAAYDVSDGHLTWQAHIVGVPYAPIVTGGRVLVATSAGLVAAYGDAPR